MLLLKLFGRVVNYVLTLGIIGLAGTRIPSSSRFRWGPPP
jgi:hypothetical protein